MNQYKYRIYSQYFLKGLQDEMKKTGTKGKGLKEIAEKLTKALTTPKGVRPIGFRPPKKSLIEKFYERLPAIKRPEKPPVALTYVPLWQRKAISKAREKGYKGPGLPRFIEEEIKFRKKSHEKKAVIKYLKGLKPLARKIISKPPAIREIKPGQFKLRPGVSLPLSRPGWGPPGREFRGSPALAKVLKKRRK